MSVALEGGCFVVDLTEGEPAERGTAQVWPLVGRDVGAQAISLRAIEMAPGVSPALVNPDCDDVLFVLSGRGTCYVDGWGYAVEPELGLFVRPGQRLTVDNPGPEPLVLVSSRCPDPGAAAAWEEPITEPDGAERPDPAPVMRLADRKAQPTADRWYRVLVDGDVGSERVTQFVGAIPPGRAPDHFHHYEEVICVLEGRGRMWAGERHTPVARGSCVFLPKKQVHCVENTGDGPLKLLGVFYPAGSPAVRYDA